MIDFVVPYVNNKDKVWRDNFISYTLKHHRNKIACLDTVRYTDSIGIIYYQLQLVNKFMPFVGTIYLLLSTKEQVIESLIPKNVKIVLHKDFIPSKYLPTFNSTTIEMFLWNIPNLSEKFIYANDDMLPLKYLMENDFFDNDIPRVTFRHETLEYNSTCYKNQCYNSYMSVAETKYNLVKNKDFYFPIHSMTPMIKSHCKECFDLIKDKIVTKITPYREYNQHNQYIYPNYELVYYLVKPSMINFYYTKLAENEQEFENNLKNCEIICVNGTKDKRNVDILERYLKELCK